METKGIVIRGMMIIMLLICALGSNSSFAQAQFKRDSLTFKQKFDRVKERTDSSTFNTRIEKIVNDPSSEKPRTPFVLGPKMSAERDPAVYQAVNADVKDLAALLIEVERKTEFERDVSPLTRSLITTANDSYGLMLISRKIADEELFEISDWLRDKLMLAIGERMNRQDKEEFSMYEFPSDHKDVVKFTGIRTGNDLFTMAGLYDLAFLPNNKFVRDGNLLFQRNDDRDYTGSLLVEIGTDYLNLHGSNPAKSYQTFLYGFDVYTPYFRDTIKFPTDTSSNKLDRPHASFQYFGWSRKALSFNSKIRWQVTLKVGKIGGSAGAKFQNALHQDISYSPRPKGWGAQIANGGRVGFSIEYKWERQWGDHRSKILPSIFFDAKLGTYMTTGALGLQMSNKTFAKSNPNFITLYKRRSSEKLMSLIGHRLMYNVAFSVCRVVHNTMLEGYGILSTNEDKNDKLTPRSLYKLESDEVKRWTALLNISLSYSTKYITYFYNWKSFSPETTKGNIKIRSPWAGPNGEHAEMDISKRWHHFAEIGVSFNIF
ncbi:MAG TPA: lipid A-modifier LpxR family protein [Cyclobacteriaceae bacterium]|nr:lipid A-modifier LpxR family protein [Cyclobacteriaceae bacterium]